ARAGLSDTCNDLRSGRADEAAESADGAADQTPGDRDLSPAALPLLRIRVGVVVERRRADSPWVDFVWRGIGVLPDEPEMTPWTVIREQEGTTLFYAGSATVDLYRSETARYRDNLATGAPSVWIVLTPSEGAWPYAVSAVTADPAEGEAFTEAGANLVEAVPMPELLHKAIE